MKRKNTAFALALSVFLHAMFFFLVNSAVHEKSPIGLEVRVNPVNALKNSKQSSSTRAVSASPRKTGKPDAAASSTKLSKNEKESDFFITSLSADMDAEIAQFFYPKRIGYEIIRQQDVLPTLALLDTPVQRWFRAETILPQRFFRNAKSMTSLFHVNLRDNARNLPPLRYGEARRKQYLDTIMSRSKKAQLGDFLREFLKYDKNRGDLPLFAREFYQSNLQRVVFLYETRSATTAIEYLYEALDKKEMLNTLISLTTKYIGTRFSTELLFMLEDIFHSQQLTLVSLRSTELEKALKIQKQVIEITLHKYASAIVRNSVAMLNSRYNSKRAEILHHVIRTTPQHYRVADAWFKIGMIDWEAYRAEGDLRKLKTATNAWQKAVAMRNKDSFFNTEMETLKDIIFNKEMNNPREYLELAERIENIQWVRLLEKAKREKTLLSSN